MYLHNGGRGSASGRVDNAAVVGRPEAKGPALPTTRRTRRPRRADRPSEEILTFSVWSDQGERGRERGEREKEGEREGRDIVVDGRKGTTHARAFIPLPNAHPCRPPQSDSVSAAADADARPPTYQADGQAGREVLQDAVRPPLQA